MTTHDTLIAKLEQQIEKWESLAAEARTRADQSTTGDLNPEYLYGCVDQLEQNAQELREVVKQVRAAKGRATGDDDRLIDRS